VPRRSVAVLVVLSFSSALLFSGCILGRRAPRKQPIPEFSSPLPPTGEPGLSLGDVRDRLAQRQAGVRTIRSSGQITVGGGRALPRQQFDVTITAELPSFVRVRGSQDTGTVFDLIVDNQDVKMLVFPERKFYRGSLNDLRRNPLVLMGISPDDLITNFVVEQNLLRRLKTSVAGFDESIDHYNITIAFNNGVSERYALRKSDLLIEKLERFFDGRPTSNVLFSEYKLAGGGDVLPSRFDVTLAGGSEFSAHMQQLQTGEEIGSNMRAFSIPDGFDRMGFGG
jgi:hypothetical protein